MILEVLPNTFTAWLPPGEWPRLVKFAALKPSFPSRFGLNLTLPQLRLLARNGYIEIEPAEGETLDAESLRAHLTAVAEAGGLFWTQARRRAWEN